MVRFSEIEMVLLDIEGTVSDVRFVYDVMFPFARENMRSFLQTKGETAEARAAIEQVARDANLEPSIWYSNISREVVNVDKLNTHLQSLMVTDSKATGLKALQGLVWKSGFETGQLRAELFPDVLPALKEWTASGKQVFIYSSGSVLAQQLFFRFTTEGDLSGYLSGHFDTTVGKKQEQASYQKIAGLVGRNTARILFVSDIAEELLAAEAVGMLVVASVRPSNKPLGANYVGAQVTSFSEIILV